MALDQLEERGGDSGGINYLEFLAATLDQKVFVQEDVCWRVSAAGEDDRAVVQKFPSCQWRLSHLLH